MKNNVNENTEAVARKDSRRAKYGSLSAVFTIVFIALVLVINLVFSSLSLSGDLTVDLTQEDFTNVGDETKTLLNAIGSDVDITVYFLAARDMFGVADNNYNGVNLTGLIRDLAETYAREFSGGDGKPRVTVQYRELGSDPEFERKYTEESATALSSTSVIIQGKYHFRVLNMAAFFETDSEGNYYSFNGEYRLTSAIMQSSISEPQVVTFTVGHGETPSNSLKSLLSEAGFEIKEANLSEAENTIDARTEILICVNPTTDFGLTEIDRTTEYLAKHNAMIVMVNAETSPLKNLSDFLGDYWGIGYKAENRITDSVHSLGGKSENINAQYVTLDSESASASAAYQIHKTVSDMGGQISTVLPNCVELFTTQANTKDSFVVETVMTTHDTAISSFDGVASAPGEKPIMLLSTKSTYVDNARQYSYVMLVGSTDFAGDENIGYGTFGNRRVTLAAARTFSANRVAPDISSKPFADTALAIETGTAGTLTVLICTVVPGILIILGIAVFLKRRHL